MFSEVFEVPAAGIGLVKRKTPNMLNPTTAIIIIAAIVPFEKTFIAFICFGVFDIKTSDYYYLKCYIIFSFLTAFFPA